MIDTKQCWLKDNCSGVDCDKQNCIRLVKQDILYNEALVSLKQRKTSKLIICDRNIVDEDSYKKLNELKKNILDIVSNGDNIYIYSKTTGNGKTEWTIKLLQAYIDKIWASSNLECRALFINVPQFLLALKDSISKDSDYIEHIKENILKCDIVIFDEVGAKVATQFELDHLLTYINARINSGKTNIYTSNIEPSNLASYVGDRLASRMSDSIQIEFKGSDMRGYKLCK